MSSAIEVQSPSNQKKHLKDGLLSNMAPTCLVQEDANEYQILFHMRGSFDHSLKLFMSPDHFRLHVLVEKSDDHDQDQFLWSFKLPRMINDKQIGIEHRGPLYLVHIPKKTWFRDVGPLAS